MVYDGPSADPSRVLGVYTGNALEIPCPNPHIIYVAFIIISLHRNIQHSRLSELNGIRVDDLSLHCHWIADEKFQDTSGFPVLGTGVRLPDPVVTGSPDNNNVYLINSTITGAMLVLFSVADGSTLGAGFSANYLYNGNTMRS